jgi:hypothetical protein
MPKKKYIKFKKFKKIIKKIIWNSLYSLIQQTNLYFSKIIMQNKKK